jgi:hypothetical protein
MRGFLASLIGVAAVAVSCGSPVSAENLKSAVRTLNAIVNPEDAWRLEDQARRYRRPADEQYWHSYGAGLEQQRRERGETGPQYGDRDRYSRIDPDEAYRLEEQARHYRRPADERYWSRYREGLERQ